MSLLLLFMKVFSFFVNSPNVIGYILLLWGEPAAIVYKEAVAPTHLIIQLTATQREVSGLQQAKIAKFSKTL